MTTTVVVWVEQRCVTDYDGKHRHITWVQHEKVEPRRSSK